MKKKERNINFSSTFVSMASNQWHDIQDYLPGHTARWVQGGVPFFDELVKIIDSAQNTIHCQVYIIDPDEAGRPVLEAFMRAAKRGVQVNLVVDDFGSNQLHSDVEDELKSSGIHFRRFENVMSSSNYYVGRRMHHKIVVVDERIGIVAGLNFANRYKGSDGTPAWLDYAVIVEGPVCKNLIKVCNRILEKQFMPSKPRWPKIFTTKSSINTLSDTWIRIRKNDFLRKRKEITNSYNRSGRLSKNYITIVGGYFLPGRKYRKILADASKRGVIIRIILTRYSDVQMAKYASDFLYDWMLRNKIHIFEYQKSMVHGKVAIVDDMWSTIGSYNQNHLSAYLSIELNLDIVNTPFATGFNEHLLKLMKDDCEEITNEKFIRKTTILIQFRRWLSYQLLRLSLRILLLINRIFYFND